MSEYTTSQKTKDALIDAAGALAGAVGFSNVSMRAVAERSGENLGSIHYHFGSKDALFEAVLRKAIAPWESWPVSKIIEPFSDRLDQPSGKAQVVRALVHSDIEMLFLSDRPAWCSQVIFQLMQCDGPLRELLIHEFVVPREIAKLEVVKQIKPELADLEGQLVSMLMCIPVYFHADYQSAILLMNGEDRFSAEYLQTLEDLLVRQTQLLLGLPDDKTI